MGFLDKIINWFSSAIPSQESSEPMDFDTAKHLFLTKYGENFHCRNEQYFRFQRALSKDKMGSMVSINRKLLKMQICSAHNPEIKYNVSLTTCDCPDFRQHRLPCKHMYKLALELGIVTPDWDLSGLSPELHTLLNDFKITHTRSLFRLMDKQGHKKTFFTVSKSSVPPILVKNGFVVEDEYTNILDKNYSKKDLLTFLELSSDYNASSTDKKEDIIKYIVQNEPKLAKTLSEKFYRISSSDMTMDNFDYIYRFLEQQLKK